MDGYDSNLLLPATPTSYYNRLGKDVRTDAQGCVMLEEDHVRLGGSARRLNEVSQEEPHDDPVSSLSDTYCRIYAGDCFATTTVRLDDHRSNVTFTGTRIRANNSSDIVHDYNDDDDSYYHHGDSPRTTTIEVPRDERYCGERRGNGCGPAWFPHWSRSLLDGLSGLYDECSIHDVCYESCGMARSECDKAFHQDMLQSCGVVNSNNAITGGTSSPTCRAVANLFYGAVSRFGSKACREARRGRCGSIQECEQ